MTVVCVNAVCVMKEQRMEGWRDAEMSEEGREKDQSFQEREKTSEIKEINMHELTTTDTPYSSDLNL